ncbi:MAG TPA: PRC-barrel domain-containing protein [Gemmatimonadaceae bacterium]|jgi:sporulation protein YlmC with PRC-barrel domain|nr:PRC-barrel domain-containing protein [Gemmatimonadaceae bacterium]
MTLRPLSSIDYTTIGRTLDLRGWRVIARDGALLGTVSELIIDVEDGTPVYINIVPDFSAAHSSTPDECWIRVPFEHTSLDDDTRRVVLSDAATLGLGTATAGLVFSRTAMR